MTLHGHRFGQFGGRYVAELLWGNFERVALAFNEHSGSAEFRAVRDRWMARIGRPTPLVQLKQLSNHLGGATIWVKRDDLLQGDSYCITAAVGQVLLAKLSGYQAVFAETTTGEFGVALASAARAQSLDVHIFMGRADYNAEPYSVAMMKSLGVEPEVVDSVHRGRGAAWARAMRHWAEHPQHMYCTGSAAAPSPYPQVLDFFNQLSGAELRVQLERRTVSPDYLVCPVGSGAYASGLFLPFVDDERTHLVGVQAAGRDEDYASVASKGVMYGTKSFVLQDAEGLPIYRDTEAGGLAHNAIGPQHATWADRGQCFYTLVNDFDAAQAARALAVHEGMLVNQETGHALAYASRLAQTLEPTSHIVVGITGSGHRDLSRLHAKGDA